MPQIIWPVVTENLAEQLSATQGGIVHPTQLLPYLPISLRLIEQVLDELASSERVEKHSRDGLTSYVFIESVDRSPSKFAPTHCIYSNEALDGHLFSAIAPEVRKQIETELAHLAQNDIWPANAVWEHELLYLANNLPSPVSASDIAGHSRLSFKKVEQRLSELQERGFLRHQADIGNWELPPLRYPQPPYKRHDSFIRQFPGALQEEFEVRLLKSLSLSLLVLLLTFALAIIARIAFPIVFFGGITAAVVVFLKVLKAAPKPPPEL